MSTDADTIIDEQVAAIADRMTEEGRQVSPVTIWSEVHSGSIVAIAAALQRWREARQPKTPEVQVQTGLPQDAAETLVNVAWRLWTASHDEAGKVLDQRVGVVSRQLEVALRERDEALVEYQKTEEEVETGRERLNDLVNQLQAAENAATQVRAELAAATARAETAETNVEALLQRASLDEAKLDATRASLEQQHKANEWLAETVSSKNNEIARITQERDDARLEVATLRHACQAKSAEVERWSQEAGAANSRAEAATTQAHESLVRLAALEGELEVIRGALAAEREATAARIDEAAAQLNELERVTREAEEARVQVGVMTEAQTAASAELARVSRDASAARDRADAAEQHAAQLEQRLAGRARDDAARDTSHDQQPDMEATGTASANEIAGLQRQISLQARAHERAYDELRATAEQWVVHAKEIKQRLDLANEKILFIDARSAGEVALLRKLSLELERFKPDHELVFRDAQKKLIDAAIVQQLARQGYRYDPATAVMSKVES